MATFTPEEIELVKSRGNNYCRQTWLGLYDNNKTQDTKDEQEIKDFMMDKYERKRYYLDPSSNLRNGFATMPQKATQDVNKPLKSILVNNHMVNNKDLQAKNSFNKMNGTIPTTTNGSDFADFGSADIFNAAQYNNNNVTNGTTTQPSFANFENNPIYNASSKLIIFLIISSIN